jgi:hypothetical protein
MKIFKSAVVAFSLAMAMGSFSSSAMAAAGGCEDGRTCFSPKQAIQIVEEKIKAAQSAIGAGHKAEDVADLIKAASDASKEINANDVVDRNRAKANNHLKAGFKSAKEGNLTDTTEHLNAAAKGFAALHGML